MRTYERRARWTAVAVAATLTAACGSDGDGGGGDGGESADVRTVEIEATPAFVAQAAEESASTSYSMSMDVQLGDGEPAEMMSGATDGELFGQTMDTSVTTQLTADHTGGPDIPPSVRDQLTMEMVGDSDAMYMRTGMYGVPQVAATLPPGAEALTGLGADEWGRIENERLGDLVPGELQSAVAGQSADIGAYLDVVAGTENVEELGTDQVQGEEMTGLSAEVTMGELMEGSGIEPEAFAQSFANAAGGGAMIEALTDVIADVPLPVEVWVDDEGLIRRLAYEPDMGAVASGMEDLGARVPGLGSSPNWSYEMDITDYGEPVDIELPARSTDVTEAFAALMS